MSRLRPKKRRRSPAEAAALRAAIAAQKVALAAAKALPPAISSVPPSLPPEAPEAALVPLSSDRRLDGRRDRRFKDPTIEKQDMPAWYLPPDSKVRRVALQAIAMRIAGMGEEEIAAALNISPKSIGPYIYRAGKNGWLDLDSPRERVELQLMHKAVGNLEAMLADNTGVRDKTIKHETTMELLKGTLFKSFGEEPVRTERPTVVAIRIEMPTGPVQVMREDTTCGVAAYLDAELQEK